jgi:hypothetical protein
MESDMQRVKDEWSIKLKEVEHNAAKHENALHEKY